MRAVIYEKNRDFCNSLVNALEKVGYSCIGVNTIEDLMRILLDTVNILVVSLDKNDFAAFDVLAHLSTNMPGQIVVGYGEPDEILSRKAVYFGVDYYFTTQENITVKLVDVFNANIYRFEEVVELCLGYTYDTVRKNVFCDDNMIRLSEYEKKIFDLLFQFRNCTVTKEELYMCVWNKPVDDLLLRQLVFRINKKLNFQFIATEWGKGYRLNLDCKALAS